VIPPKGRFTKDSKYQGAFVKDAGKNSFEWLSYFDLKGLYPSLIMQFNIGPDTIVNGLEGDIEQKEIFDGAFKTKFDEYTIAGNGVYFRKDEQSFLFTILKNLFKERDETKTKQKECEKKYEKTKDEKYKAEAKKWEIHQKTTKIMMNSIYGAMGSDFFRFFDVRLAEAITKSGRLLWHLMEHRMNIFLNEYAGTKNEKYIVAGDTDSIVFQLKNIVKKEGYDKKEKKEIVDFIDKFSNEVLQPKLDELFVEYHKMMNCNHQMMKIKREKIIEKAIWRAKKMYCVSVWDDEGVRYKEPKIGITGLEPVRSTSPEICKKKLKECYKIMLTGNEEELWKLVSDFKKEFFKLKVEEIAFPKAVHAIDKFIISKEKNILTKGTPFHVRGTFNYNRLIKNKKLDYKYDFINPHDKIKFIYLVKSNPTGHNVIAFKEKMPDEFQLERYYDMNLMWQKTFLLPLKSLTDILGWEIERPYGLDIMKQFAVS
jgi:DNA polymerase elongation subunit (family B)